MNCEKCGTFMQPTGEFLGGFPFVGCPNCGSEETKQKIQQHYEFMLKFNKKAEEFTFKLNSQLKKEEKP
jgi:DNA-directed RNA polymerase subunit M/transcription elongation factor TFIIS